MSKWEKWRPTEKWWALVSSGLASIAASWIVTGAFDDVERGMAATLLAGAVASYWKRNKPTAPSRKALKRKAAHVESRNRRT